MIKIILVDDHIMFREGLKSLLELEKDLKVIGEANNGNDALNLIRKKSADIVLLDIKLPDISGMQVCKQMIEEYPNLSIIMLTAFHDENDVIESLRAGAKGYVLKNSSIEELVKEIRLVSEGKNALDAGITNIIIKEIKKSDEEKILSLREIEIVNLIYQGLSNDKIAQKLFISKNTVKAYVHKIMEKLNVSSRTAIIYEALQRNLINKSKK